MDKNEININPNDSNEVVENDSVKEFQDHLRNEEDPLGLGDLDSLSEESINKVRDMLKTARVMVETMENIWSQSRNEFKLTQEQMFKLWHYNDQNKTAMPYNLSEEEKSKWDNLNGLDNIPEDVIYSIFGEEHPIIGVHIDQTRDRIKTVFGDYYSWTIALKEYNDIDKAFRQILEISEEKEISKLKLIAENESDPDKKNELMKSIDSYYSIKYLDFLRDPLSDEDKLRLINAWGDEKKIEYWISRSRDKLNQLNINSKFILEISQFEKRFLCERYHKLSNFLLVYFMNKIVFSNTSDPKSSDRSRIVAMVTTLDNWIRRIFNETIESRILENIAAFLDQIIDDVYNKYFPDEVVIPRDTCLENTLEGH